MRYLKREGKKKKKFAALLFSSCVRVASGSTDINIFTYNNLT